MMVHIKAVCIRIHLSLAARFLQNLKRSWWLGGRGCGETWGCPIGHTPHGVDHMALGECQVGGMWSTLEETPIGVSNMWGMAPDNGTAAHDSM